MKSDMKNLLYVSLIAVIGILVSCQKENDENTLTLEGHV